VYQVLRRGLRLCSLLGLCIVLASAIPSGQDAQLTVSEQARRFELMTNTLKELQKSCPECAIQIDIDTVKLPSRGAKPWNLGGITGEISPCVVPDWLAHEEEALRMVAIAKLKRVGVAELKKFEASIPGDCSRTRLLYYLEVVKQLAAR
jgi:hypothetical protein